MGERQSAAFLAGRLLKILSAETAAAAAILAAVLAILQSGSGAVVTTVCYGAAAAALTTLVVVRWRRDRWQLGAALTRRRGIVVTDEFQLSRTELTGVTLEQTPFLALFDSVRVWIKTPADSKDNGCRLTVRSNDGQRIVRNLLPTGKGYVRRYKAGKTDVLLMAASSANFVSGLFFLLPLTAWLSRRVDALLAERLGEAISITGKRLLPALSPVLSAALLLPAVGWLIHLAVSFFTYGGFELTRSGETIMLSRGLLTQQASIMRRQAVTSIERRRTLLLMIFGRESCRFTAYGCGCQPLFLPCDSRQLTIELSALFPKGAPGASVTCTEPTRWWRWWAAAAVGAAVVALKLSFSAEPCRVLMLTLVIPAVVLFIWRAGVCAAAARHAGVYCCADSVEAVGVRGITVCRLRVMRGCIAEARISQNIFQQSFGLCNMYIRPAGARRGIWCRHLPEERCRQLLGRLG